jgi:hypothetical protein
MDLRTPQLRWIKAGQPVVRGQGAAASAIDQPKKSPAEPGFEGILETGVSRGSKETTRALQTLLQRIRGLSG